MNERSPVGAMINKSAEASCAPMGRLEYVVESRIRGDVETWFVVRPHKDMAQHYADRGVTLSADCRVVVEADSLRPVGVLACEFEAAPSAAGYNPYFDLPPA